MVRSRPASTRRRDRARAEDGGIPDLLDNAVFVFELVNRALKLLVQYHAGSDDDHTVENPRVRVVVQRCEPVRWGTLLSATPHCRQAAFRPRCRYRGTAKAGSAAIAEVFAPPAFATIRSCRGSVVLMFMQPGAEAGRNRVPNRMRTSI